MRIISQKEDVKKGGRVFYSRHLLKCTYIFAQNRCSNSRHIRKKTASVNKLSTAYITDISSCARSAMHTGRWCGYNVILLNGLSRFVNDDVSGLANGKWGGQT